MKKGILVIAAILGLAHTGKAQSAYGNNILSFAPLQMTEEGPRGIGIHYERQLDSKGIFYFYAPMALSFLTGTEYSSVTNTYDNRIHTAYVDFFPGLKICPTGSHKKIYYGVGPSLAFGFGQRPEDVYTYDPITGTSTNTFTKESVFRMGILVNNSINVQPTTHFYMSMEFGIGYSYFTHNNSYYSNDNDDVLLNLNFKVGYRF